MTFSKPNILLKLLQNIAKKKQKKKQSFHQKKRITGFNFGLLEMIL